jgi:hypothetical protein
MARRILSPLLLVVGLLLLPAPATRGATEGAAGFKVIVNASNPIGGIPVGELSHLFMKRVTRWASGATVVPVDLPASAPVRERFSREVHGKPVVAVEAFWTRQIYSGQDVPPLIKSTEKDVVSFVRDNAGAIGYVSEDLPLEGGVKAIGVAHGR